VIDFKFSSPFVNNHLLSHYGFLRCELFVEFSFEEDDGYWDAFSMQLNPLFFNQVAPGTKIKFGPSFLGRRKNWDHILPKDHLGYFRGGILGKLQGFRSFRSHTMDECVIFFFIFSSFILRLAFILQLQLFIHLNKFHSL
jgi:hypothetical protein